MNGNTKPFTSATIDNHVLTLEVNGAIITFKIVLPDISGFVEVSSLPLIPSLSVVVVLTVLTDTASFFAVENPGSRKHPRR